MKSNNTSIIHRIWNLFITNLAAGVAAGFFAGVFAGLIEVLIKGAIVDYFGFYFIVTSLLYYPIFGVLVSVVVLFIMSILMGIFTHSKRIPAIVTLLFISTLTYLLTAMFAKRLITVSNLPSFPGFRLVYVSLVVLALFFVTIALIFLFRQVIKLLGIKLSAVPFLIAALIISVSSIAIMTLTSPPETGMSFTQDENISESKGLPNIIIIMMDTMRADWLSIVGYDIDTPNFQEFAEDGILYTNYFNQCSWTKPSIASLFTSLYPTQHTVGTASGPLDYNLVTLAEVLQSAGYHTVGLVNNPLLKESSNFNQGFSDYHYFQPRKPYPTDLQSPRLFVYKVLDIMYRRLFPTQIYETSYRDAEYCTESAMRWVSNNGASSFFMFLHFMDTHSPYFEHPYEGEFYRPPRTGGFSDGILPKATDNYKQEIRFADESLGEFLGYLKKNGMYDESMIVVTADHGEEFNDHGAAGHGRVLYNELLRASTIIKLPLGEKASTVDSSLAQSIDIAPTISSFVDARIPDSWEGIDLFTDEKSEYSVAELQQMGIIPITSIQNLSEKLIITRDADQNIDKVEYYDLIKDPLELNNVAEEQYYKDKVSTLLSRLQSIEQYFQSTAIQSDSMELDVETIQQLKALGYLQY
ncbi:MAG: sulfatase-like hydrolase/transferase [candidate division Zixibacteria bacterium]|nr:sulfatase-like hydrolase/transferase [candidate division Zixibacteria bacterium]